ncbi:MAG: 16S rRNA (guanine(966)-N(2))-methyltransferase RsmD, partial [Desulfarculaceae bacterium]
MRISGGQWRGRRLKTPPGVATRPTSGKVKEALFNILGPVVSGARVADLFAGSGALGLEALSRGAAFCLFVEKNKSALKALEDNLATLAGGKQAQVLAVDAIRSQRLKERGPFSLILADPPYDQGLVKRVV